MSVAKRLSQVYQSAQELTFDDTSNIVLMSDCHRGDGSHSDNFSNNQLLFFSGLSYYYSHNYTYIELGDGDELWENRDYNKIIAVHSDVFWLMSKLYHDGRFYMLYGNHDVVKKNSKYTHTTCSSYFDDCKNELTPLFPNIKIHEGLLLKYENTGDRIFLTHGHQGEFLNDTAWRLGRFLIRYLWRPLELIGIENPTSSVYNYSKKGNSVENNLSAWAKKEKQMLIAGHTHHPVFPDVDAPPYFNDGSGVHPRCITAIEINHGSISLVKWNLATKEDRTLYVAREVLEGPVRLEEYFQNLRV